MSVSAVYLPNKRPGLPAAGPFYRGFIWLVTVVFHYCFEDIDLSRCSEVIAGFACACILF